MKKTGLNVAAALAMCGLLLAACSPALNWRTVQLKDAPLQVLLPCDPQTASRPVDLGMGQVQMSVLGCEAQGATYAVSNFSVAEPAAAAQTLANWQQVVLAQLRSNEGAGNETGTAKKLNAKDDGLWVPKGALNLPQSVRVTFEGVSPKDQKIVAHSVWFARLEGASARVYHAVIYGDKAQPVAAEMFFSGLLLQ